MAKELEIVRSAQQSAPTHVDAEYQARMTEMGSALESMSMSHQSSVAEQERQNAVRSQMKEMQARLAKLEKAIPTTATVSLSSKKR